MKKIVFEIDKDTHANFRRYCFDKNISMREKITMLILQTLGNTDAKK